MHREKMGNVRQGHICDHGPHHGLSLRVNLCRHVQKHELLVNTLRSRSSPVFSSAVSLLLLKQQHGELGA